MIYGMTGTGISGPMARTILSRLIQNQKIWETGVRHFNDADPAAGKLQNSPPVLYWKAQGPEGDELGINQQGPEDNYFWATFYDGGDSFPYQVLMELLQLEGPFDTFELMIDVAAPARVLETAGISDATCEKSVRYGSRPDGTFDVSCYLIKGYNALACLQVALAEHLAAQRRAAESAQSG